MPAANRHTSEVKLPRIEIPKFSGDFQAWTSFHDLFSSMVDCSTNLTGAQKMHYLRSSVEGEAEQLIRSYKVTDVNYTEAWKALCSRYQNRRRIVNSHLDEMFSLKTLSNECSVALRQGMDTFSECVRALNALELPIQHWDVLLVHAFVKSMDGETKRLWELSLTREELPSFETLRNFTETRCRSLEAAGSSSAVPKSNPFRKSTDKKTESSNEKKLRAFLATAPISCVKCQGTHAIVACPEFLSL